MKYRIPLVAGLALASAIASAGFAEEIPPAPPTAPIGVTTPQPAEALPAQTPPQSQAAPQQAQTTAPSTYPQQQQIAPAGPKVLVIPFAVLNIQEGEEWIGRGVEESLVADLGHGRSFSTIAYKGQLLVEDNATAISLAHKANADYVIRGAAQRVDQTLRITAQLIDSRNGDTIAAATVTGSAKDLLKLEDELASQLRTSAMPIVAAEQQHQLNYIPGNYLPPPPQSADSANGPYYPGYENTPTYVPSYGASYVPTETSSYQPPYYDPGYAYSGYAYGGYPYYGYPGYYNYGYPYYGYYPSAILWGGSFFWGNNHNHGHDHDHDHDGHWSGGNWNGGRGNWNGGHGNWNGNGGNWNGGNGNRGNWNGGNGNWNRGGGTLVTTRSPRPISGPFGAPNVGFNFGAGGMNTGFHPVNGNVSHFGGFGGGMSGGLRGGIAGGPQGGFSGGGVGSFGGGGMRGGGGGFGGGGGMHGGFGGGGGGHR